MYLPNLGGCKLVALPPWQPFNFFSDNPEEVLLTAEGVGLGFRFRSCKNKEF